MSSRGNFFRWPAWNHVTIWKIDISTFTRLTATKPGRDKGFQGQGAARKGFIGQRLLVLIISLQIIIFVAWMKLINKETENHDEDGGSDEVEYYWIIILSTLKFSNWKNCREPQNMMAISDQGFPQKRWSESFVCPKFREVPDQN